MSALQIETETPKTNGENDASEEAQSKIAHRKSKITLPLLLEVGCEEIPARFLRDAENGLGDRVEAALHQARLLPEAAKNADAKPLVASFSTPRRLTAYVAKVLRQQPDKVEEVLGPPVKVAVDGEGKYTRAAESFAQKNSAALDDLARTTTPKGEYLSLRKTTPGRPAGEVLAEILPGAILGLSFPKSMYWTSKADPRFVRPIRWIVAILGEGKHAATVDFDILGVPSGDFTFGHRARGSKAILVSGFKSYAKKLTQAHVEIEYTKRCLKIVQEAQTVLGSVEGRIVPDEWLVDWIANATEWPHPILGSFDPRFLHLPREILITVMRDHQRYFAIEDEKGNLRPHFVAVLNMDSDEQGLIRQGHQRVLTARFRDAEFFWSADQKIPLRDRVPLLDKVTYQVKLGSYGDKIRRISSIAEGLCVLLEGVQKPMRGADPAPGLSPASEGPSGGSEVGSDAARADLKVGATSQVRAHVLRAVELCKCDLTTQMVQEFTELQGVVGGLYARAQGEPAEVADAVYDHYLPLGAEGASPRTLVGAMVSVADKLDSVAAGFAVGLEPTGSSDPFALRRQANGIIKVILEFKLSLSLASMVEYAFKALDSFRAGAAGQYTASKAADPSRTIPESKTPSPGQSTLAPAPVLEFFAERLRYYFESVRHFRYDTVRAVMAAGWDDPVDALARAEAMEALRGGEDFEALSAAAKRIRNILAKSASASDWQQGDVDPGLLSEEQERTLHEAYGEVAGQARAFQSVGEYRRALETISTLRPAVDRFFDKVLVMAEDLSVRQNRLRLLARLDHLFSGIAHFAEIEGK